MSAASRSLRARPPWPTRRPGGAVGRADLGGGLQPEDVAKAEVVQEAEQLGVGEPAIGQEGDPDAVGQHRGQPAQAGVLVGVAGVLQVVLEHAEPDPRRRPAVAGHEPEPQGGLPVGVVIGPVHRHDDVLARPDRLRDPGGEDVPGLEPGMAQQPVDRLDGVCGEKTAGLGQGPAEDRDAQRGPGHHPQRGVRQGIDPLGVDVVVQNTVQEGSDVLELQEPAPRSVVHPARHRCLRGTAFRHHSPESTFSSANQEAPEGC